MSSLFLLSRPPTIYASSTASSRVKVWTRGLTRTTTAAAAAATTRRRRITSTTSTSSATAFIGGMGKSHFFSYPTTTTTTTTTTASSPWIQTQKSHSQNSCLFSTTTKKDSEDGFFANSDITFQSLGIRSPILLERIENELKLSRPTAVQAKVCSVLLNPNDDDNDEKKDPNQDIIIGAETGSGKTLAYLLPILDDIFQRKERIYNAAAAATTTTTTTTSMDFETADDTYIGYDYARAIILVPNKELVQQVAQMAMNLCGGPSSLVYGNLASSSTTTSSRQQQQQQPQDPSTLIKLAILPGGLQEPQDFPPFRSSKKIDSEVMDSNVDILIATPAVLGPFGLSPKNIQFFADVQTLIVDEADMLLDGGYIRQLENVLMGFRRADRLFLQPDSPPKETTTTAGASRSPRPQPTTQHIFVAATLPDMGLRSVHSYLQKKFPHAYTVSMSGFHNARHYGLKENTVWIQEDNKKNRIQQLIELLETPTHEGGIQNEKIMIFLNSVEDVEGATIALENTNIVPPQKIAPYHAKIPLQERQDTLNRFRKYNNNNAAEDDKDAIQILICTDLASRGLDIPNVNVIIQLQFAENVVSHLHRMGRCGRAGKKTGKGIIFYSTKEKELVSVIRDAELEQQQMKLEGSDVQEETEDPLEKEQGGLKEEANTTGTVKNAFSRKRGFTKKRKKIIKKMNEEKEDIS